MFPLLLKVFEKVVFNQLSDYLEIFSAVYYVVFENDMGLNTLYSTWMFSSKKRSPESDQISLPAIKSCASKV